MLREGGASSNHYHASAITGSSAFADDDSIGFKSSAGKARATMPQRVLITAGAAGIGREFARAFAATGAKVFVCDIDKNALEAIAQEIPGLIAKVCNMARRADIERMVPDAVAALGGLDVLINNA